MNKISKNDNPYFYYSLFMFTLPLSLKWTRYSNQTRRVKVKDGIPALRANLLKNRT